MARFRVLINNAPPNIHTYMQNLDKVLVVESNGVWTASGEWVGYDEDSPITYWLLKLYGVRIGVYEGLKSDKHVVVMGDAPQLWHDVYNRDR